MRSCNSYLLLLLPAINPGASARLASGVPALEVCTDQVSAGMTHKCAWLKRSIYVDSCSCTNMSWCGMWKIDVLEFFHFLGEVAKNVFCYGFASVFSLEWMSDWFFENALVCSISLLQLIWGRSPKQLMLWKMILHPCFEPFRNALVAIYDVLWTGNADVLFSKPATHIYSLNAASLLVESLR
jgi:hypothetical protein